MRKGGMLGGENLCASLKGNSRKLSMLVCWVVTTCELLDI
jgi:hypothetical protein